MSVVKKVTREQMDVLKALAKLKGIEVCEDWDRDINTWPYIIYKPKSTPSLAGTSIKVDGISFEQMVTTLIGLEDKSHNIAYRKCVATIKEDSVTLKGSVETGYVKMTKEELIDLVNNL